MLNIQTQLSKFKEKINENYTIVSSTLVATDKRPEIKIEWRIYAKSRQAIVRDLIMKVKFGSNTKEEFNSIIQGADGNIEALLANLKNFQTIKSFLISAS